VKLRRLSLLLLLSGALHAADWEMLRPGQPAAPVRALLKGDRLFFALGDVLTPLGGAVETDPITRQVVATLGGRRVQFDARQPLFTIEMKTYVLTALPFEKERAVFVPQDFYTQALPLLAGFAVTADAAAAKLTLSPSDGGGKPVRDANPPPPPPASKRMTVVLDPGHGGSEEGANGPGGLKEKDATLALALRLKPALEREGYRVILTRADDRTVPLRDRPALANQEKAALFISIHMNSSPVAGPHGTEVYYLGKLSSDDATARLVAAENAGVVEDGNGLSLVLWDMAQNAAARDSATFAVAVQNRMNDLLATPDRGVRQAPFVVLKGSRVPAILVEVAFISNPQEEAKLKSGEFLDKAAAALTAAVKNHLALRAPATP